MSEPRYTGGICMVCRGEVVEDISTVYDPETGPLIIGPGSKNQFRRVSKGFYCKDCGIKYQFPPQLRSV